MVIKISFIDLRNNKAQLIMDHQVTGEVTRFFERKKLRHDDYLHPYLEDIKVKANVDFLNS